MLVVDDEFSIQMAMKDLLEGWGFKTIVAGSCDELLAKLAECPDRPTLVICGTHDQRTPPACSWEIASAVKGAELHLLAECGHCSPIEDPAAVNVLLRAWLERAVD